MTHKHVNITVCKKSDTSISIPSSVVALAIIHASLENKLPIIWTDGKAEVGRVKEEKVRRKKTEKRKSQKKEGPGARKGRKVAKHSVFPKFCGSGGSKSRLAKAAGAEPSGQMRDEKLHTKHVSKSKS